MSSSAQKGAYYKSRTRKWLAKHGYQVVDLEVVRWLQTPRGRIPVKRDQLGADLQAVSATELIFVQVKGGKKSNAAAAVREFSEHVFPPFAQLWIVYWKPLAREPEVIDVKARLAAIATGRTTPARWTRAEKRSAATAMADAFPDVPW